VPPKSEFIERRLLMRLPTTLSQCQSINVRMLGKRNTLRSSFRISLTPIAAKEGEYFLGSIVVTTRGALPEVVDGQQRLATTTMTTTILLAAIRDYLVKTKDLNLASVDLGSVLVDAVGF
jgi:hypothetical protein